MSFKQLPSRQIHLDFHTGPQIGDVGSAFDPDQFGDTFARANVNSVTVFAKCHHGHLYYNTDRPERHPGLAENVDLLRLQVDALHKRKIRAPIYISVQCDEWAADNHPEWIALEEDGRRVGRSPLAGGNFSWQILDMSSPYQDFLYEQTVEVLEKFDPVDGLFFDMCWDQPSLGNWAKKGMLQKNLNPASLPDRQKYAHSVALNYMKRFYDLVQSKAPGAGVYFNSRPLYNLAEEIDMMTQVEIEALPTGGWGYMYFPTNVRYARTFDRPYLGMTARFHKSWADFGGLKPYAALEYETSQMMAHGAGCSIGDQLHPRGTLDEGAYDLIGRCYKRVADREPWLTDARPLSQVGLLLVEPTGDNADKVSQSREGATRMLTQLRHQFDIVTAASDWSEYDLIILPDLVAVDGKLSTKLDKFLSDGGAVLATGLSGLSPDGTTRQWSQLPVDPQGLSPFTTTYMRFGQRITDDVPASDHVLYDTTVRVKPSADAEALASVVEPYFERGWNSFSSHAQTPTDKVSDFSLAVIRGKIAYVSAPAFGSFARHGNYPLRLLVRNVIDQLLPEPLVRIDAPTSTEATLVRQQNRTIVHLLQYCPERRTRELDIVEDIVPLFDIPLSIKLDSRPNRVYLAPSKTEVSFEYTSGRVNLRVPKIEGHAMIVFE